MLGGYENEISKQKRTHKEVKMAYHKCRNPKRSFGLIFLALVIAQIALVSAADNFEEILQPLTTIYDLVKYSATAISGIVMVFAGINYITSGADPMKRENAKNMIMYVIIGLMVIWAAPFVVSLILG